MRLTLLVLATSLLLPACTGSLLEASETGTESGEGEASGGDSEAGGEEASSSSSEGGDGDGDGDGSTTEWTSDGGDGDGDGDTTGTTGTTDTTGDGDGDTTGTTDTTGDGDGDTTDTADTTDTTGGSGCDIVEIQLDADEAQLEGQWSLGMSQLAPQEGAVVFPNDYGAFGSATFEIELPCDDDWHIWVKGLDRGTDDSFFVQVDGSPGEPAIFDIDCGEGNNQGSYEWEHLNERPPNDFCGEGYDWVVSAGGTIDVTFFEREAGAISALAVSNDPGYVPGF